MNEENKEKVKSNVCLIKDCSRQTHKESKYCIFHASVKEKTEEEFKEALKKYVDKIKKEDGDCNFEKFIFVGDIDFHEDLNITVFKNANLSGVTFKEYANFFMATFKGYANLGDATFEGDVNLGVATFEGNAIFFITTFKGNANLIKATFKGNAYLIDATFEGDADFQYNKFLSTYSFKDACFKGNVLFDHSIFSTRNDLNLKVNREGLVSFKHACIENIFLELDLDKEVQIDFNDSILRDTKIKKGQIENRILQEKEKKYSEAKKIYLLLKNNFHSLGQYEDESWAFKKEKDMERMSKSFYSLLSKYKKYSLFKKILKQGNLLKRVIIKSKIFSKWLFSKKAIEWFNLSVSDFIYQYGENPWRVIRFALIIIFLFAIILNFSGIVNSDNTNLIIEFIKKSQSDEYTIRYLGPILGSFLNCLYFSVVTFTTLGYGDFQPAVGLSRFFVSLESIIGAITMALFVYTFARRTGGR